MARPKYKEEIDRLKRDVGEADQLIDIAKAELLRRAGMIDQLRQQIVGLQEDLRDYEALFSLQTSRMQRATKVWQLETGHPDVLPDLGKLLDWLLSKCEEEEGGNKS